MFKLPTFLLLPIAFSLVGVHIARADFIYFPYGYLGVGARAYAGNRVNTDSSLTGRVFAQDSNNPFFGTSSAAWMDASLQISDSAFSSSMLGYYSTGSSQASASGRVSVDFEVTETSWIEVAMAQVGPTDTSKKSIYLTEVNPDLTSGAVLVDSSSMPATFASRLLVEQGQRYRLESDFGYRSLAGLSTNSLDFSVATVPEPGSFSLIALATMPLAFYRRRQCSC